MAGAKGKYNKKMAAKIIELYGSGKHNVEDICEKVGIARSTFFLWKATILEFSDGLEAAMDLRIDAIKEAAVSGLYKLVNGFDYEEVKTDFTTKVVDGKEVPKVKAVTKTKKHVQPNPKMIEYALNNTFAERFKTSSKIDHTNNGESFNFGNFLMGDDDLEDSPDDQDIDDQTADDEQLPDNVPATPWV